MVEFLLQCTHFLHEFIGVVGGHLLSDLVVPFEVLHDLAEAVFYVFPDGFVFVQLRFLHQDADGSLWVRESIAVRGLVNSGHDLQNAGLTGAVRADNTNLRTVIEGHGDIIQDDLLTKSLAHITHGVDEL